MIVPGKGVIGCWETGTDLLTGEATQHPTAPLLSPLWSMMQEGVSLGVLDGQVLGYPQVRMGQQGERGHLSVSPPVGEGTVSPPQ